MVQVRADLVLSIVTEGLALGVRGFVDSGAGFTDSGEVAEDVHDGLLNLRKRYQFDVVGPNCMGFVDLVTVPHLYVGQ